MVVVMSDIDTLLPPNALDLARTAEVAMAEPLVGIEKPVQTLWDPETCPASILPWLAWTLSVDDWDPQWPEGTKRSAIAASIMVHQKKGTAGAVKAALVAAGYGDATLVENDNGEFYDGSLNHDGSVNHVKGDEWAEYRVYLVRPITLEQAAQVRAILQSVAPARCRLKALDYTEALNTYNARIDHDGQYSHGVA
jgi:phage tail P2-like protein